MVDQMSRQPKPYYRSVLLFALTVVLLILILPQIYATDDAGDESLSCGELAMAGRHEEAIECFNEALSINPRDAGIWNCKGASLIHLERYEEAIECFNEALNINPRYADAWSNKGAALDGLGKYTDAIVAYDEASAIQPEYIPALINKGWALIWLGMYQDAERCFRHALLIDPKSEIAWYGRGCAYYVNGSYNEAIDCYDELLSNNPKFAEQWNGKGLAFYGLRRYNEALTCLAEAIRINPQYAEAWNNKGIILSAMRRYEEAIECYNKSLGIDPIYAEAWAGKGSALAELGRYEEAIECYDTALIIYPFYSSVWQKKSIAHERLGQSENATKYLNYSMLLESLWTYPLKPPKSYLKYHLLSTEPPEVHPLGSDASDFEEVSGLPEINESQDFFMRYYELDLKLYPMVEERNGSTYLVGIFRNNTTEIRYENLGGFFMPYYHYRRDRFDVSEMSALAEYYLERSGIKAAIAISVNLTSHNGEVVAANETTSPAASFRHVFVLVDIPGGPYILDPSRPDFNESMIRIIGPKDPEYHRPYYKPEHVYENIYDLIKESSIDPHGWLLDEFDWWNSPFFV